MMRYAMSLLRARFYICVTLVLLYAVLSRQECPEEYSMSGLKATWPASSDGINLQSNPVCFNSDGEKLTRNCSNNEWTPPIADVTCYHVEHDFDDSACPPGYHTISYNSTEFCYEISDESIWDYPCYKSGGATTITDLNSHDLNSLLDKLDNSNTSRYFWLPARRQKIYNPLVWTIPGPNWGREVRSRNSLSLATSIFYSCLLLDVKNRVMITQPCSLEYPSLCFYINDAHNPAKCPEGYNTFRFMPDDGACFGIVQSDNNNGSTFDDFLNTKCDKPMGNNAERELATFVYTKMARINNAGDQWCWFFTYTNNYTSVTESNLAGVINSQGFVRVTDKRRQFQCMACEMNMTYEETELNFEYNQLDDKLYLSVFIPSGLWRYNTTDKGVQCFSNAKGFAQAININDIPIQTTSSVSNITTIYSVDKIVYEVDPVTTGMAQYWCEGHTKNFSLIKSKRIIANPQGDLEHVFVLCVKVYNRTSGISDIPDFANITDIITNIANAKKVTVMDVLEYNVPHMTLLLHVHVVANKQYENDTTDLKATLETVENTLKAELPANNITFINMTCVLYCLPTTSIDIIRLDWELTPMGEIAAPKQFCLQSNGLPVKRSCIGSYMFGSFWGDVDGTCDGHYEPTNKTTFLYDFVKGNVDNNSSTRFLTDGLNFILNDTSMIIPADIYYLSMSLQQVSIMARHNKSTFELGDLENIAWAADRLMDLNSNYLNLAQTLNSTNMLLESVTDIIEILALPESGPMYANNSYQLAIEPQFLTQISFPMFNNITGIALVKNSDSDLFTDMIVIPLFLNSTMEEVLAYKHLEIATWIPDDVFTSLIPLNNTNQTESYIVINIYRNDAIFQIVENRKYALNSRIVEIEIPGFSSDLLYPLPLVFREVNFRNSQSICGFWDFQETQDINIPGSWEKYGCSFFDKKGNLAICKCYHMTHFAQLITVQDLRDLTDSHKKALNIITLAGSFLSLIGITGIWLTALIFSTWRRKAGTKVLLQLSAAIAIPLIIIIIFSLADSIIIKSKGVYEVSDRKIAACIVLGALLHYAILAGFVWMLITAVLQFIRYVRVIGVKRPSRFMIKLTVIGWGVPALPVLAVLAVNKNGYLPEPSLECEPICYPHGIYFILGVLVPVIVIIIINMSLFLSVMYSITKGPNGVIRSSDLDLVKAQLRLSIFLFFLLGLTWIFGVMSFSNSLFWSYLFCLTSTLQGFVLFVYFIICDPATRHMWVSLMKPPFGRASSRGSITSFST